MILKPARSNARDTAASCVTTSLQLRPCSIIEMTAPSCPCALRNRFSVASMSWLECPGRGCATDVLPADFAMPIFVPYPRRYSFLTCGSGLLGARWVALTRYLLYGGGYSKAQHLQVAAARNVLSDRNFLDGEEYL